MSVTYYVALPFIETGEGLAAGPAQECPNERSAIWQAEAMSRDPIHSGALVFKSSGDPSQGNFGDATVLKKFGLVPDKLEEF